MPQNENYFDILDIPLDASFDTVEQGYRRAKRQYEGDTKRLQLIEEAYRTLINPFKKDAYLAKINKSQGQTAKAQPSSPQPAPEEPRAPVRRHGTSVFGVEGKNEPPAEQGPKSSSGGGRSKTQIFGGSPPGGGRTPEPKPQTDLNSTPRTPEPAPQPPSSKQRSKTQIVSGSQPTAGKTSEPKSQAPSSPPARSAEPAQQSPAGSKPAGRNKTQVVGSGPVPPSRPVEPQPPAEKPHQQPSTTGGKQSSGGRTKTVIMGSGTPGIPGKPDEGKTANGGTQLVEPSSQPASAAGSKNDPTQIYPPEKKALPTPVEEKTAREFTQPVTPAGLVGTRTAGNQGSPQKPSEQRWEAVVTYNGQSTPHLISPGENLVGRPPINGPRPPVPLDDPDKFIGRTHASIKLENGKITIQDNGSANGTLLNGQKIAPNQPLPFREGDLVVIEGREIRIRPAKD
jgi:curved DNA-binding protein CbpA